MKHLGDITAINGAEVEPVDVVTGGSPCQDLSIAGKRAGLAGARSGLFMEQVRIVKEMRASDRARGIPDELCRPRYMVWENVPGAFSSNGRRDFAAVLEEIIRIAEPEAPDIEVPEKGWPTWGGYHDCVGGRWSVAWRVHDAQHWGVPLRRRRISIVADFGGDTACEVSFERKSVSGDIEPSGTTRERLAGEVESGVGGAGETYCLQGNGIDRADTAGCNGKGWKEGVSYTLNTIDRHAICAAFKGNQGGTAVVMDMSHACDVIRECGETVPSLQARMGTGGNQVPLVYSIGNGQADSLKLQEKAGTLNCMHDQQAIMITAVDCRNGTENADVNGTLQAKSNGGQSLNLQNVCRVNQIVRRLTPLECERLQGFPDGWTDIGDWYDSKGKLHRAADSPRYKALGNSIALPFWDFLVKRISAQYPRSITMGSLFDGIGGFPLVFERYNGKGSARWASEIEEFPIAVTKLRFGED